MKEEARPLLTAPQVARHCSADLKTIHNWVNAGQIRSFRTPGRHLRFRPEDVVEFLERYGYPVPQELQKYSRQVVMIIDPDTQTHNALKENLEPHHDVRSYDCPVKALLAMEREHPDLIVSEVDLPGVDGLHLVRRLAVGEDEEAVRQCPVLVYSSEGDEKNCIEAGAAAVIRKPNIKTLRRRVGQLLSKRGEA